MDPNLTLSIISVLIGVLGLGFGVIQLMRARNQRSMYEEKCATRCKDLEEIAQQLSKPVLEACRIKDEHFDTLLTRSGDPKEVVRPIRVLSDQIHAIYVARNIVVRFCERLDEEHREEFGREVFGNIRSRFTDYPNPAVKASEASV